MRFFGILFWILFQFFYGARLTDMYTWVHLILCLSYVRAPVSTCLENFRVSSAVYLQLSLLLIIGSHFCDNAERGKSQSKLHHQYQLDWWLTPTDSTYHLSVQMYYLYSLNRYEIKGLIYQVLKKGNPLQKLVMLSSGINEKFLDAKSWPYW